MTFEIRHRITGSVLFSLETTSLKLAVEAAVKSRVNLRGANLRRTNLRGANLWGANLREADLWGADLHEANLWGANLQKADLWETNLRGANLWGANLRGADLWGANLLRADLRVANLRGANLWRTKVGSTILPTGETLEQFNEKVVPALLVSGGKTLKEIVDSGAWECHDWSNCPIAVAFGVHKEEKIPILHRPRAEQFIQLFDFGLIPKPNI